MTTENMTDPTNSTYNYGEPAKVYEQVAYKSLRSALMNTTALQTISRR